MSAENPDSLTQPVNSHTYTHTVKTLTIHRQTSGQVFQNKILVKETEGGVTGSSSRVKILNTENMEGNSFNQEND